MTKTPKETPPLEEVPAPAPPEPELKESDLILQFHWKDLPVPDQKVGKAFNELVEAIWAQLPARTGRRKYIEALAQIRNDILKPPLPLKHEPASPADQV